jgi:hypothetical protein
MAKTFFALLPLADLSPRGTSGPPMGAGMVTPERETDHPPTTSAGEQPNLIPGLHYNIQIHLPATKDVEVYNAIFKSLKEHLVN